MVKTHKQEKKDNTDENKCQKKRYEQKPYRNKRRRVLRPLEQPPKKRNLDTVHFSNGAMITDRNESDTVFEEDFLGKTYERFAKYRSPERKKRTGMFYTPAGVGELVARLAVIGKEEIESVYPSASSGRGKGETGKTGSLCRGTEKNDFDFRPSRCVRVLQGRDRFPYRTLSASRRDLR